MQKKFSEFYKPTKKELKQLWDESHFVFDANTLLNLYIYTKETVDDFWSALDSIKDRLWISFQAGYEFHNNRPARILTQQNLFQKTISSLNRISDDAEKSLVKNFNAIREHPSINEKEIVEEVESFFKKLIDKIQKKEESHPKLLKDEDEILNKISKLFKNRVGSGFSEIELKKIFKEGEKRYSEKIPPGFADIKEKKGIEKYGDLVIWKEILNFANHENVKSIIFITDDAKEDWWKIVSGKTIGPHPKLIKEFQQETGKKYYQYNSAQFLDYAKSRNPKINEDSISEINRVASSFAFKNKDLISKNNYFKNLPRNTLNELFNEVSETNKKKIIKDFLKSNQSVIDFNEDILNERNCLPLAEALRLNNRNEELKRFYKEIRDLDDGSDDEDINED